MVKNIYEVVKAVNLSMSTNKVKDHIFTMFMDIEKSNNESSSSFDNITKNAGILKSAVDKYSSIFNKIIKS